MVHARHRAPTDERLAILTNMLLLIASLNSSQFVDILAKPCRVEQTSCSFIINFILINVKNKKEHSTINIKVRKVFDIDVDVYVYMRYDAMIAAIRELS